MPQINVRVKLRDGDYKSKIPFPEHDASNYKAAVRAWRLDCRRLENQLKLDLFEEHGVSGLAADLVWAKAWEHGHSVGLDEVVDLFEDFLDILIAARKQYAGSLT